MVSQHFGHTPEFLIVTVEDGKVVSRKVEKSPGHEPGLLPRLMAAWGVTHVITGGLGKKALEMFNEKNIKVISGVTGTADVAIRVVIARRETTSPPAVSSSSTRSWAWRRAASSTARPR
jgi:predicted Fe-Mo cluster-binding NifX family protein